MSLLTKQPGSTPIGSPGSVPHILVVDDEQHMCDVCGRTLRRAGYAVTTTSDPKVAVDLLHGDQAFDLLLTDIKMPTMSGLDLAHVAKERDPAIAIIIMTGFASMENLHQSVQRGVADFLSKPFELDQLRLAVDQALHKRSLLQDNLRLRAIEQLLASSEALGTTLDLSELTDLLLEVTLRQIGCRAAFVLLVEAVGGLGRPTASGPNHRLLAPGRALANQAYHQRQLLSGKQETFAQVGEGDLPFALAVPLRAQGEINGVLLLCDDQPSAFLPGAQEEIALLANYAGSAIRNALLYQQLGDAYQRLQELDRLKSEFIAIASHELRTPLSIILGYTMMLRDQHTGDQHDYVQRVMESAKRIKDIVDDMVSLRHLETGEERMTVASCSAMELLTEAAERFQQVAADHRHEVRIEVLDEDIEFESDREKIALILGNLLSNAIRFTADGGRIALRAALHGAAPSPDGGERVIVRPLSMADSAAWVSFEVQDSGIGIPEREQSRIFERFYQVADSLTRDHGGTGLGLAVVRELTITLGGMLWVVSQEGQGSTFAVALPRRLE